MTNENISNNDSFIDEKNDGACDFIFYDLGMFMEDLKKIAEFDCDRQAEENDFFLYNFRNPELKHLPDLRNILEIRIDALHHKALIYWGEESIFIWYSYRRCYEILRDALLP